MKFVLVFLCIFIIKYFFRSHAIVKRPYKIKVKYITQDWKKVITKLEDFNARVFIHEFEHLLGKNFNDLDLNENEFKVDEIEISDNVNFFPIPNIRN